MKKPLIFCTILFSYGVFAQTPPEVPPFPDSEIIFSEEMDSSNPDILMKQVELSSTAASEDILDFYKKCEFVDSCEKNDMADNYICKLKTHDVIKSGYVFIDDHQKKGKTNIFMDYFYYKK